MKVVLLGYMASGKSTTGKTLARRLNTRFFDLDDEISNRVGMDIPTIFSKKGELFFRKTESIVLNELLQSEESFVLSMGGGTPCYGNNIEVIQQATSNTFYINLSIPDLIARISKEKDKRPLVSTLSDEELPEFLGKHLFERAPFYNKANHTIMANGKTVEELVSEIENCLV